MSYLPELLLKGGRVFCGLFRGEILCTEAVVVDSGKILAVGYSEEMSRRFPRAKALDMEGALLLPGLCDGHLHLAVGGRSLSVPDLSRLSEEQIKTTLLQSSKSLPPKAWVRAFNWDPQEANITADLLESWLPGRLVIVHQRDLHSCCVSQTALSTAGITGKSADPPGGVIERDSQGRPNGRLRETASNPIMELIPRPGAADQRQYILAGQDYLLAKGLTAVGEVIDSGNEEVYSELEREGLLKLQIDGWRRLEDWTDGEPPPPYEGRFRVETIKIFLDGSFGSRTAALNEPFSDSTTPGGDLNYDDEELFRILTAAQEAGWRAAMHAIGDRALAQAVRVLRRLPRRNCIRHRIEHLQLLPPDFAESFAASGAMASIQPVHLIDDQKWVVDIIGEARCRRSFIWKSLEERLVPLVLGSDWPVADPDPLLNIHVAINRAGFGETPHPAFNASEALSPASALDAATLGWARAACMERERGLIAAGFDADLTLVTGVGKDLRDWSQAKVVWTMCGGRIVSPALN